MPSVSFSEILVISEHTDITDYNLAKLYSTQSAIDTAYGAGSATAKATAKVFAQGVPHVRIVNVYKEVGTPKDYATVLAGLQAQQVLYDIIVPTIQIDDTNFGLLVTHAQTYMKVLVCPVVNHSAADALVHFKTLTLGEEQYGITTDSSANTVGEIAGATAGAISKAAPWNPVEWNSIAGINPAGYSMDDVTLLETDASANVNTVITVGSATVLSSGRSLEPANWLDIFRTKQYLAASIRTELINLKLRVIGGGSKIPYSPAGMALVRDTIERICRISQAAGALREDYVENGAIVKGYVVTMPVYGDISSSDKAARLLQNIFVTCYISGAVSTISLTLNISL